MEEEQNELKQKLETSEVEEQKLNDVLNQIDKKIEELDEVKASEHESVIDENDKSDTLDQVGETVEEVKTSEPENSNDINRLDERVEELGAGAVFGFSLEEKVLEKVDGISNIEINDEEKTERAKSNKKLKLILGGLTAIMVIGIAASSLRKNDTSFDAKENYKDTYQEFEITYLDEYNIDLTDTDKTALKAVYDWLYNTNGGLISEKPDLNDGDREMIKINNNVIARNAYNELVRLSSSAQALIIEDALKELPKGITYVSKENCTIVSNIDKDGVHYFVNLSVKNAFSEGEPIVYTREIKSEEAIELLNKCNAVISNNITQAGYERYCNTDIDSAYDREMFSKCCELGDGFENMVINAIHTPFKFGDWKNTNQYSGQDTAGETTTSEPVYEEGPINVKIYR